MTRLQKDIEKAFIEKLKISEEVSDEKIKALQELFDEGEKLKVNDLMSIFKKVSK